MEGKKGKEVAKKLSKEEKKLQRLRDILLREEALDQVTLSKIQEKWYNTLLNIRVPEMQENLKHILHFMEKIVESHNYQKQLFEEEKQEQYELDTLHAQCRSSAIEMLYDIYEKRVEDLQEVYRNRVNEKKNDAETEFKEIMEREISAKENLESMLFQMEQNRLKEEDTMNCDMFLKIDDEISKNTETLENIRAKLEKKKEARWEEILTKLEDYEQSTLERKKSYVVLKTKDDSDSKIIYQQMKKTKKLLEQLNELKNCVDDCYASPETLENISDLEEEKAMFYKSFKNLKRVVAEELKEDHNNLKYLTTVSNTSMDELQKICSMGKKILTLFRICRKYETEEEKVVPVGEYLKMIDAKREAPRGKRVAKNEEQVTSEILTQQSEFWTKDYDILNGFWRKVGKVRLSTLYLLDCINNLEIENTILKKSLLTNLENAAKEGKKRKKFIAS